VGSKGSLFGRYIIVDKPSFSPSAFPALVGSPTNARFQNAGLSYTHIWTPRILTETRLGYNREFTLAGAPGSGTNYTAKGGIAGFDVTGAQFPRFPNLNISGYTGLNGTNFPLNNNNNVYEFTQNVMITAGKHAIKAGIDFWR
jgi:hypothetical protein